MNGAAPLSESKSPTLRLVAMFSIVCFRQVQILLKDVSDPGDFCGFLC